MRTPIGFRWLDFYDKKCMNVLANGSLNFEETVEKFGPDKAAKCLQTARRCFRPNLLRAGLQRLCWDATGAVLVQREMTRSHAVVCVAHYLLGIGDRHLNNIMIDISTGRFVGIDFGHAFGTGLFLAVPELVPFRLTRQFVEAMGPLGVDGHFTSAMRLCLSAVRNNKHLLLNTMDVFVKEPLINWQGGNTLVNADANQNYPQRKLEIAASKLAGRNPVSVMQEELKQGKRNKKTYLDQISIILCGKQKSTTSPRGFPVENLTVEQQTDCLVQLATDDAIVSRIFRGWEPWL
jgi:DNA-dependent protein kinase catalytic subunit